MLFFAEIIIRRHDSKHIMLYKRIVNMDTVEAGLYSQYFYDKTSLNYGKTDN